MSLFTHAVAFGIGMALGRPEGRRRFERLQGKGIEVLRSPQAQQVADRGRQLAGDGAQQIKRRLDARKERRSDPGQQQPSDSTAGDGTPGGTTTAAGTAAPTADAGATPRPVGGTTVAEDSQAVVTGIPAPPLAAREQEPNSPRESS